MNLKNKTYNPWAVCLVMTCLAFGALLWFSEIYLKFNSLRSDPLDYWRQSNTLRVFFDAWHPPAYSAVISILRFLGRDSLAPLVVMRIINAVALFLNVCTVFNLIRPVTGVKAAYQAAILFLLWPFTGVVYAVHPLADNLGICFLLLGVVHLISQKFSRAFIFFALMCTTHKGLWSFAPLCLLSHLMVYPSKRSFYLFLKGILIIITPMFLVWLAGAQHYGSWNWIFATNLKYEIAPKAGDGFLVSGIVGTFLHQGSKGLFKGALLLSLLAFNLCLLIAGLKYQGMKILKGYGLALTLGITVLFLTINERIVWAVFRFGKVMIVPMFWFLDVPSIRKEKTMPEVLFFSAAFIGIASQFWFMWYLTKYFNG
jgi:hypothetical protein